MMKKLYIHGLGQTPESWSSTIEQLGAENSECMDLAALLSGEETTYRNLYSAFAAACNQMDCPLVLCGLSLGAVLALNYAGEYPQKVKALVLIAPQYKMPKGVLQMQNLIFRLMPKSVFSTTGFEKADFIKLCRTMMAIDLKNRLSHITCPVLVICGEKDAANKKAAMELGDLLQNAEIEIISNAKHEINQEAPQILADLLQSFYRSVL